MPFQEFTIISVVEVELFAKSYLLETINTQVKLNSIQYSVIISSTLH